MTIGLIFKNPVTINGLVGQEIIMAIFKKAKKQAKERFCNFAVNQDYSNKK